MQRTSNGFVQLEGDDLLENALAFFMGTKSSPVGDAGECPWDHSFGTPWDLMRHRNVRQGTVERYVAITNARFKKHAATHMRLTGMERFSETGTALRTRWYWRNAKTGKAPQEGTDVSFAL